MCSWRFYWHCTLSESQDNLILSFFSVLIWWFLCTKHDYLLKITYNFPGNIISFVKLNLWWNTCLFPTCFWLIFRSVEHPFDCCSRSGNLLGRLMSSAASLNWLLFFSCSSSLSLPSHFLKVQQEKDERSLSACTRKRGEDTKGLAKERIVRDRREYLERTAV